MPTLGFVFDFRPRLSFSSTLLDVDDFDFIRAYLHIRCMVLGTYYVPSCISRMVIQYTTTSHFETSNLGYGTSDGFILGVGWTCLLCSISAVGTRTACIGLAWVDGWLGWFFHVMEDLGYEMGWQRCLWRNEWGCIMVFFLLFSLSSSFSFLFLPIPAPSRKVS